MSIRQPGMERKERNFNREGKREGEKKPGLLMKGQRQVIELEQIEGQNLGQLRMAGGEIDNRYQHEQASCHGIDHELDCGIDTPAAPPHSDQKIHGNQHHFPEDVKKKKIER